jgi:hypothetical protein
MLFPSCANGALQGISTARSERGIVLLSDFQVFVAQQGTDVFKRSPTLEQVYQNVWRSWWLCPATPARLNIALNESSQMFTTVRRFDSPLQK